MPGPPYAARFCKKRISMPDLRGKLSQSFEEIMSMLGLFSSPGLAASAGASLRGSAGACCAIL
ncbi:MAG: hypothetical protein LBU32_15455 [Clostridiales bacterium]|nr:hypothetical protein [Clostridiales bacterium]